MAGMALHSAFQPVVPLPLFIGKYVSQLVTAVLNGLKPLIPTKTWDALKVCCDIIFIKKYIVIIMP
jgi:hypothetical protein